MKLGMWLVALCLAGCGGHSGPPTYSIGGQVSGLSVGSSLVLTNNGQDGLTVSANGTFTFSTALPSGSAYSIAVSSQPSSHTQYCTVADEVGTLSAASVTSVSVVCVTAMTLTTTTATTAENELVTGRLTATDASGAAVSFAHVGHRVYDFVRGHRRHS